MIVFASIVTGKVVDCTDGVVTIKYDADYSFNKQRLEKPENIKIVNEVFKINPLAHVFIQTQPKNYTGVHTPYREAIINIVSHFQSDGVHTNQVHLLDLLPYYKLYQAAGCNDSMVNGHFTAVGWEYCAEILAYAWSNYINQNPLKFQDVNLIQYGESN